MVYRGRVKGGVVVLDDPEARIPEGMAVRVETITTEAEKADVDPIDDPFYRIDELAVETEALDPLFTMGDLAVDTGIADLSGRRGDEV